MEKEANQVNPQQAHSKCSEQWKPVYAWLESLDKKEVVKSKEISDWLYANPKVKELLNARFSHYQLMHYIQKCHSRILKRQEKQKLSKVSTSMKINDNGVKTQTVPIPCNSSSNVLKDNEVYIMRRNEALRKYKMQTDVSIMLSLTELEHCLSIVFSKSKQVKDLRELKSPFLPIQDSAYNQFARADKEGRTRFMPNGASLSPTEGGVTTAGDLGLENH